MKLIDNYKYFCYTVSTCSKSCNSAASQPKPMQTYEEQVLEIVKRKNIPHRAVDVDSDGRIIVDKDKDPELYDWAVNG